MNNERYAAALKNTLTEIQNTCPDVRRSFIFSDNKVIATGEPETDEKTMEKIINIFQSLTENGEAIGSLKAFYINGKKGKVIFSDVNNMYLALEASKNADTTYLHSIIHVVVPTILKLLETIAFTPPTPPQATPSKQLVVDSLSGFFVGDSVQIDTELLEEWARLLRESVSEVEIEAFGGEATQCKVKEINDSKLKGKGMIRIPEKICKTLEVKKGELVTVKPAST